MKRKFISSFPFQSLICVNLFGFSCISNRVYNFHLRARYAPSETTLSGLKYIVPITPADNRLYTLTKNLVCEYMSTAVFILCVFQMSV